MKVVYIVALIVSIQSKALANPAAVECNRLHGEMISGMGTCGFGGATVDEWTLYNYHHGHKQMAIEALLRHVRTIAKGNEPDDEYCKLFDGFIKKEKQPQGYASKFEGTLSLCIFSDHSAIEVETLRRGPKDKANEKLMKALETSALPEANEKQESAGVVAPESN